MKYSFIVVSWNWEFATLVFDGYESCQRRKDAHEDRNTYMSFPERFGLPQVLALLISVPMEGPEL